MSSGLSERCAVLAPGGNNNPDVPLLAYARLAATRRGATVQTVSWELAGERDFTRHRSMVAAKVEAALAELPGGDAPGRRRPVPLLIGKSLGSLAAPVAAERGLPAIWLTPLLTDEPTVAALLAATAPFLLIGGTADRLWDGPVARAVTVAAGPAAPGRVVEIPSADHSLLLGGPLAASAAVLGQVMTAIEDFLDQLVWPGLAPAASSPVN